MLRYMHSANTLAWVMLQQPILACLRPFSARVHSSRVQMYALSTYSGAPFPSKHKQLKFFYNDVYTVQLPEGHRFPMQKYRYVREALQTELTASGTDIAARVSFHVSPLATTQELCSAHCPRYVEEYTQGTLDPKALRRLGFPWSLSHVQRARSSTGGTVAAMRTVLSERSLFSGQLAGGTHHAFKDYGEGFCVFNDIAVAARLALTEFAHLVSRILIIDLDVHQGNGSASIFNDDPRVFTFSMHCDGNYFSQKQKSDIDVEVPVRTGDAEYLDTLKLWIPALLDRVQPQLVFYQAGVDPLYCDRLGKLSLTHHGLSARNKLIYESTFGRNIPLVVTMGGGYPKDLTPTSEEFLATIQAHKQVYIDGVHTLLSLPRLGNQ